MKAQKHTSYYKLESIKQVMEEMNEEFNSYQMTLTSSSIKVATDSQNYLFMEDIGNIKPVIFHNKIKKQVGDLHADIQKNAIFYDFSGIKKIPKNCFCVDINSAYLTVLKNESLINQELFQEILVKTKKSTRKMDRLKAIGLFASNKVIMEVKAGEIINVHSEENPQNWIFWLCCQKTTEAMIKVKNELMNSFLMYWVDGIFLKDNPEKAVNLLKELGFNSKIEHITDLKRNKNYLEYKKDGKRKILFLPKNNSGELMQIKKNHIRL